MPKKRRTISRRTTTGKTLTLVEGGLVENADAEACLEMLQQAHISVQDGACRDLVVLTIGDLAKGEVGIHCTIDDPGQLLLVIDEFGALVHEMRQDVREQ